MDECEMLKAYIDAKVDPLAEDIREIKAHLKERIILSISRKGLKVGVGTGGATITGLVILVLRLWELI